MSKCREVDAGEVEEGILVIRAEVFVGLSWSDKDVIQIETGDLLGSSWH